MLCSLPCGAPCVSESPQLPPLAFTALSAPLLWTVSLEAVFGAGVFWRSAPPEGWDLIRLDPCHSLGDAHRGRGHVRTQPDASAGGNWDPPDLQDPDLPVPCLGRPPRD